MFVWGGGGLQFILGNLYKRGLLSTLVPNDPRCKEDPGKIGAKLHEKILGAEMTRRTFTNCCNIMKRHDFYGKWMKWRKAKGIEAQLSLNTKKKE